MFEIEFVNKDKRPYYLFARQITPGENFSATETRYLNGYKLKTEYYIPPRALAKDGLPRSDIFTFRFVDGCNIKKFFVGQIVEMTDK